MSYEPVRWGILSTAHINRLVIPPGRESPKVDLVAVGSRSQDTAEEYASKWQIPRAHGSYEALLADPDVEAIYISLPNSLHVEWSIKALEAGKHVLCEKPFSRRVEEVERAFDVADSAGLVLSEGFMFRHHPQTAKFAELVADGVIGRLRLVRAAFSFPLAAVHGADDARFRPELDGGALMDVGSYCVNASRFLAGEPESVSGEQVVGPSGVDVVFAGALTHAGEVVSHFDCGFVVPRRGELEIVGEEATLVVGDPWHVYEPGIELRRRDGVEQIALERANSYQQELENIADAVRGDALLLLGRDDAVGQARTIEALYRSAA
jgi:D-xylose 1-dehydrogenase (NADP+, D-xylono-1,5-lactone-forming)